MAHTTVQALEAADWMLVMWGDQEAEVRWDTAWIAEHVPGDTAAPGDLVVSCGERKTVTLRAVARALPEGPVILTDGSASLAIGGRPAVAPEPVDGVIATWAPAAVLASTLALAVARLRDLPLPAHHPADPAPVWVAAPAPIGSMDGAPVYAVAGGRGRHDAPDRRGCHRHRRHLSLPFLHRRARG